MNITYQLVWTELLDTENKYINLLQDVYDKVMLNKELDYKKSVGITQIPFTQLKQKLLGNWFELLSFHKIHVLPTLKECNGSAKMIKYWASIMISRQAIVVILNYVYPLKVYSPKAIV
ncbi:hypothetical protein Smp_165940 [Schistosoma mansoni]|uniref:hypothetical protein n=1 Tax=Schistosoma mansoni TaxID=6183 RepID=UPI0001A61DFE|nr:hypothetical protein Smp_165940 [Schistosoma mansoni]|eukprot:XP_018648018.1 hypothetical protein Smp_165940 [Schistosoma mansoni]